MPLKYRIVLKKDMSKGAAKGDQLYYGQIRSLEKTNFKKLCKLVSGYCTAKPGEVELVIDGLIYVLCMLLESGNVIQMGEFGNFRMVAGSKGSATLKNFDPMLFKKARIVFPRCHVAPIDLRGQLRPSRPVLRSGRERRRRRWRRRKRRR